MEKNKIRRELQMEADCGKLEELLACLRTDLEQQGCPADKQTSLEICAEEIFVNIASYAYSQSTGKVYITEEITDGSIMLCFQDQGIPYDPLSKEDPDITLSAQERQIGGLGIYMVKTMMDEVSYEYRDGSNCLTMKMTW